MNQFRLIQVVAVLFTSFSFNSINAQTIQDSLPEVVITDSKIERPERQTSRPVEIITSDIIEKYQGKGLDQLLADQAGVQINGANSNPGAQKSVFVRGAASSYTLILIDGLPVADASTLGSTVDLRTLNLNQVDRVEIAKGSQSTLYGSDAIAGVINIITKQGTGEPFSAIANLSYGSWETEDWGLSLSGSTNKLQYNAGYQLLKTDGISEAFDPSASETFDSDGLEKQVISASFKYNFTDKLSIAPSIQKSNLDGGYDDGAFSDAPNTYESDLTNLGIRLVYNNDVFKLNAAFNNVEADRVFNSSFGTTLLNGTTQNADIFASYQKEEISLVGGIHYQNASITDEGTSEVNPSWNIFSPYANFIYNKNTFQVEAGLRFNNHSNFGSNINYAITPSFFLSDDVKLFASYTTAFKAPVLYQLYGGFGSANPDLKPQTSATFELGSKYYFNQGSMSLTYFNRNIDDVILFAPSFIYENFAQQKDQGVEFTLGANLMSGFYVQLSYTYLDGFTDDGTTETDNLYKRPTSQVGVNIDYDVNDKISLQLINQFYSDRTDIFYDTSIFATVEVNLKSYLRTDLSLQYQISQKATLFLHLNNLWDNEYFETHGFTVPGINARFGGTYKF